MTGIILAGGKSSRMGQDKGLMLLSGKPMISYVINTLKLVTNDIIIVSNNDAYKAFGFPVQKDVLNSEGSLVGIYSGLIKSKSHNNIVLSCDVPFVSVEFLNYLVEAHLDFDVSVPIHNGNTEQLMGIYSKNCLPVFKNQIVATELKIKSANRKLNYQEIKIEERLDFYQPNLFTNINTPEDFQKALII